MGKGFYRRTVILIYLCLLAYRRHLGVREVTAVPSASSKGATTSAERAAQSQTQRTLTNEQISSLADMRAVRMLRGASGAMFHQALQVRCLSGNEFRV